MFSTTSSRKDVVSVTDDELYDWVKSIYKEEELDPKCLRFLTLRSSNVFTQPSFKEAFLAMRQLGRSENRTFSEIARYNKSSREIELTPREEVHLSANPEMATLFQMMASTDDFVVVDAMIRLGADTDLMMQGRGRVETPLSWHCTMIKNDVSSQGHINPIRLRIIHRLLQVGVDPNIGYPLHHACWAGDIKTAALLLEYGADPSVVKPFDNKRPHQLLSGALRKRFQKLRRRKNVATPPKLCWCLISGLPFEECHGGTEPKECDPFFGCPCRSRKLYGKCCQKQGIIHTETRERASYQQGSMVLWNDNVSKLYDDLMIGVESTDKIFNDLATDDPHHDFRQRLAIHMMNSARRDLFDPAYGHALKKICFSPTYAVGLLPKKECKDRRDQWNAAVDDYIATKDDTNDHRDAVQIERLSKVAWDGTRLYKECPGCGTIEDKVEDFKACSQCKMRHYCSKECQVQHWRSGGHKEKCGNETESENETLYFPSHKSINEFAVGYMSDFMIEYS